jgi:hypothetical protein
MGRIKQEEASPDETHSTSPVTKDITRHIGQSVQRMLWAQSGGFCQFDACELSLIEHHVTKHQGNFADKAHIVAFREGGSRSDPTVDSEYIHSLENLMLLCKGCHKLIDDNGELYPRGTLEVMKAERIDLVRTAITNRAAELRTHIIAFEAPIGGRSVVVADHEMMVAIRPRNAYRAQPIRILVNNLAALGETPAFYQAASEMIEKQITSYMANGGSLSAASHISVFAIGPIPLLVQLGAGLPDKIPIQIHHKRNNPATWVWNIEGETLRFGFREVRRGKQGESVVLALSISGAVPVDNLDATFGEGSSIYELHLVGQPPARTAMQKQDDLEAFKHAYASALGKIAEVHGVSTSINLLPAVPAAVAVACGLMRHPKAHGPLIVHDLRDGAYHPVLEIGK